jgi:hypothetical protein
MNEPRSHQVGGDHYQRLKLQPWDVLPEWLEGWSPWQAYLVGNIIKYLCRAPRKGARLDDARKAQHYLEELIRHLEDEPQLTLELVPDPEALRRMYRAPHETVPDDPKADVNQFP